MLLPLCVACFDDDTSEATRPLSEIVIEEGSIKEVYNVDKNETLVISPVLTQTNTEKPLNYVWEIDLKTYSTEKELNFHAKELGTFNCRFIVENEDGKTFFPFKLNVNSPYEEGITVISTDAQGKSMLSFMQTPLNPADKPQFTQGDCFALNNPDYTLASNAVDIVQSSGRLIIACQGSGVEDDIASIYYLNEKTLVLENLLRVPEYADFVPVALGIPASDYQGIAYPVLCENGKVYEFSTTEGTLTPPRKLQSTYALSCIVNSNGGYYYDILFWDKEIGGLALIYNAYGPYYCSSKYHASRDECTGELNYFNGKDFVSMTKVRMTDEQLKTNNPEFVIVTKNESLFYKSIIETSFWDYNWDTMENYLVTSGLSMTGFSMMPVALNETTPCIANKTYLSLLFADGNKVRRWNYTTNQLLTAADELLTVGKGDNAVITSFEISKDHTKTYVAFYEPDVEGLNGSVWVFNTDTGEVLEEYNNICYKPTKMIYKNK